MSIDQVPALVSARRFGTTSRDDGLDLGIKLSIAIRTLDLENRRMRAAMARIIGLSDNEFGALAYICEVDQPTPKALVAELGLTTGAVTAMIDRLESTGLITRRPHPTDRRSTVLNLTPYGENARVWIFDGYRDTIASSITALDSARIQAAVETLLHVSASVHTATDHLGTEGPAPA